MTIVRDDGVLGGEPRIEGTRVGARHVAAGVIDRGQSPAAVAEQLDLTLAAVYEALSYYYANVDEVREAERDNAAAAQRARDGSLGPKDPLE